MKQKTTNLIARLPAEVTVESIISHPHCTEVMARFPPPDARVCPGCGSCDCIIKDSGRQRTVRHVPSGKRGTLVTFRHRRYLCKACRSSFYEPVYWIRPGSSITQELFLDIRKDLASPLSIRGIALRNCVTESIVQSVISSIDTDSPSSLPETLCIDEFCGESGTYNKGTGRWDTEKFHCILADGDKGYVLDILPRMDKAFLKPYLMGYPLSVRQKVKFCCCDMHGGYISLAKECFPSVSVCVDLFHVVKRLGDAMDSVRIRIQHALQKKAISLDDGMPGKKEALRSYQKLKGSARLLTTAERNQGTYWEGQEEKKKQRLRDILSLSPDLATAYDALQEFHHILDLDMYQLQRAGLTDWIRKYTASTVPEVTSAANTIKHYRSYIQNSMKYGKSNSVAEGRNRAIKEIKRHSYGQHSFDHFRRRILLAYGPVMYTADTYTVFGEKRRTEGIKAYLASLPVSPASPKG